MERKSLNANKQKGFELMIERLKKEAEGKVASALWYLSLLL